METSNISGVLDIIGKSITGNMNCLSMLVNLERNLDMVGPLYKVGEEVILQAKVLTSYNGNHIIEALEFEEMAPCVDGIFFTGYSYKLVGLDAWVIEPALRKKYPPSEFTFDQLMNSLNLETVK